MTKISIKSEKGNGSVIMVIVFCLALLILAFLEILLPWDFYKYI